MPYEELDPAKKEEMIEKIKWRGSVIQPKNEPILFVTQEGFRSELPGKHRGFSLHSMAGTSRGAHETLLVKGRPGKNEFDLLMNLLLEVGAVTRDWFLNDWAVRRN